MFEALAAETTFSHYIQAFATTQLDYFFIAITYLGNPALWLALGAFLYWKGEEKKSFFLTTTLLFTSALVGILKPALGRLRPPETEFRVLYKEIESPFSMPSGHATTITGVFGYYWEKFRKGARTLGLLVVLLVLASRIYLGAHYIGDVIVGGLFGFLIGRLVHALEQNYARIKFDKKRLLEEIGLTASVTAAIIIILAFRSLALGTIFLGYFAGAFAFKLLKMDSEKVSGKKLLARQATGFFVFGILGFLALETGFTAEILFVLGAWVSLIYPYIYSFLDTKRAKNQRLII